MLHASFNVNDFDKRPFFWDIFEQRFSWAKMPIIHNDCSILMQSNWETAALDLDIMEEMVLHQEGALKGYFDGCKPLSECW